ARPGARGAAQERAERVHAGRAHAVVDDERHAGRSAGPSRAGRSSSRDATALGPTLGAARLQRARVARSRGIGRIRILPRLARLALWGLAFLVAVAVLAAILAVAAAGLRDTGSPKAPAPPAGGSGGG